jgi:hypothetical protein
MGRVISEIELNEKIFDIYQEEYLKILNEKWDSLSVIDKQLVVEMLKTFYPEKTTLLKEDKWYNTVGDIVGIFDPTGVVDLINGISYWRQGDKLFAILSWVSVIPYLGDLIAKPVVGLLKVGGATTKAFKSAALAGDAMKIASTAKNAGGPIAKLVESTPKWGTKLIEILRNSIGRVPGLGKGLVNAVEEYIQIFTKAKGLTKSTKLVDMATGLTAAEKQTLLRNIAKEQSKLFRGHKGVQNSWLKYMKSDATLGQKLYAGVPRIFGGNPATRSLMRRTKTYLGFLDTLGLGNFVGPEELEKKVPDVEKKWEQYSQTPEAQKMWEEEMGLTRPVPPPPTKTQPTTNIVGGDAFSSLLGNLLGGGTKLM